MTQLDNLGHHRLASDEPRLDGMFECVPNLWVPTGLKGTGLDAAGVALVVSCCCGALLPVCLEENWGPLVGHLLSA